MTDCCNKMTNQYRTFIPLELGVIDGNRWMDMSFADKDRIAYLSKSKATTTRLLW